MALVVQKYGGSSVADANGIKRVAQRIVATRKGGDQVVVVVSAMGDSTDELMDLASQVSPLPPARELDMLLTAGERISMALLAMAIATLGLEARSFTGSQAGVITDAAHGRARIIDIKPGRIADALADGAIPIVAGFQGVSQTTKDVTTMGRGASDTTAVALAAALAADACEIYTDVDGVFTADPRIVRSARRIPRISYEEMLEMAACGAKVLMPRCVEYARRYGVSIHVRSSFTNRNGTWVMGHANDRSEEAGMEQAIISGVAHDRGEAKITVVGVPDRVGEAAKIFKAVAEAGINIDMIVQNVSAVATGRTDISFTLPRDDGQSAIFPARCGGDDGPADLASMPATGLRVQSCGDCHLNNLGTYASPEHARFLISMISMKPCRLRSKATSSVSQRASPSPVELLTCRIRTAAAFLAWRRVIIASTWRGWHGCHHSTLGARASISPPRSPTSTRPRSAATWRSAWPRS